MHLPSAGEVVQRTLTILTQSVTKLNGALEAELKHFFLSLHIHITILCREKCHFTENNARFERFHFGTKW